MATIQAGQIWGSLALEKSTLFNFLQTSKEPANENVLSLLVNYS